MRSSYLGYGKKICEVLISGEWHHLPVEVLVEYEFKDELLYRCHACKNKIVLHRESKNKKNAAHFEHKPFNRDCSLRFTYNEEFRDDKPLTKIIARKKHKTQSFAHSALLRYSLDFSESDKLASDLEDLKHRSSLPQAKYLALVDARCGQGQYRKSLIELWQGCSVTGATNISMLKASHILPWSKCRNDQERLDKFNGFLLSPNLDTAFDRHFISFDNEGKILISRRFRDYRSFGIRKDMQIDLFEENLKYLAVHQDEFNRLNV